MLSTRWPTLAPPTPGEDETKWMTAAEAAQWASGRGLKCSPSRLVAWITVGASGVKLRGAYVAGRWFTSAGALREFASASTRQRAAEDALTIDELRLT